MPSVRASCTPGRAGRSFGRSWCWWACSIAAGTSAWWWLPRSAPIRIAVLPLDNLNHAAADDYFSDGLTDEIIRNLAIIDGLAVRSQTSSFAFKGKPENLRDTANQLEPNTFWKAPCFAPGQLRIDVQLVRALDDSPLWSERYDRVITDVFAIQDEISRGIVNSLRLKLGRGRRRYETSVEAYDLYLRARSMALEHGFAGHNEERPDLRSDHSERPFVRAGVCGPGHRSRISVESVPVRLSRSAPKNANRRGDGHRAGPSFGRGA